MNFVLLQVVLRVQMLSNNVIESSNTKNNQISILAAATPPPSSNDLMKCEKIKTITLINLSYN